MEYFNKIENIVNYDFKDSKVSLKSMFHGGFKPILLQENLIIHDTDYHDTVKSLEKQY